MEPPDARIGRTPGGPAWGSVAAGDHRYGHVVEPPAFVVERLQPTTGEGEGHRTAGVGEGIVELVDRVHRRPVVKVTERVVLQRTGTCREVAGIQRRWE